MHQIHESLLPLAQPIDGLTPDPDNARVHSDRNLDAIAASLRAYGQRKPIVAQRRDDGLVIRAGNGTVEAARRLGWSEVAALVLDEDDVTAAAYGLADNRTAELATWDEPTLARVLEGVSTASGYDPLNMGFEEAEVIGLLAKYSGIPEGLEALDLGLDEDDDEEGSTSPGAGSSSPSPSPAVQPMEAPTSHVRMVQLFLTEDTHEAFLTAVRALAGVYGTTNLTDTIREAVTRAAKML